MIVGRDVLPKSVHQEVILKVAGNNVQETFQLFFLSALGQYPTPNVGALKVNIVGVTWSGAPGAVITITRDNVIIMTLQANNSNQLDFGGQEMVPDTINNTSDIVVTISGGQAECWLKLHKVAGYNTLIEPEQYGPYDDPDEPGPYVIRPPGLVYFLQ